MLYFNRTLPANVGEVCDAKFFIIIIVDDGK